MNLWEKNIRKVVPYIPGEQPNKSSVIKLNTNENPYPPAPGVRKAKRDFDTDLLKRYPDPENTVLVKALEEYYRLDEGQVFVGVGSDDVLAMAFMTFFNAEKPILFPDVTYSFYPVWAELFKIPYETQRLDENYRLVPEDYHQENGGIIFPNPNAPTGIYEPLDRIEDILKQNQDVIVIIDEAYIDFGGESALPLLNEYDNLLIVQTFSKSRSMAGMRIGYAMGSKQLIKALNDVKYSFNSYTMNQTALYLGVEAIKDDEYFKKTIERIVATREEAKRRLKALGFHCLDSKTNFIFATHPDREASELSEALKTADIYVRHFKAPRTKNYLRISIGTDQEMEQLYDFLERLLDEK